MRQQGGRGVGSGGVRADIVGADGHVPGQLRRAVDPSRTGACVRARVCVRVRAFVCVCGCVRARAFACLGVRALRCARVCVRAFSLGAYARRRFLPRLRPRARSVEGSRVGGRVGGWGLPQDGEAGEGQGGEVGGAEDRAGPVRERHHLPPFDPRSNLTEMDRRAN